MVSSPKSQAVSLLLGGEDLAVDSATACLSAPGFEFHDKEDLGCNFQSCQKLASLYFYLTQIGVPYLWEKQRKIGL